MRDFDGGAHTRMSSLLRQLSEAAEKDSTARARLAEAVGRLLDLPPQAELAEVLVTVTSCCPGVDAGCVLERQGGAWLLRATVGLTEPAGPIDAALLQEGPVAEVVSSRRLSVAAPLGSSGPLPGGTRAACAVPLLGRSGELLGVALFGSRSAHAFDHEEVLLARVAAERAARILDALRLENELASVVQTTARTSGFRDQILAIVGHDLRNPLGAILMSAVLLQKKGGLEGWQAKTVDRVRSSAMRMARIIDDLLSYTRTRLGGGIPIQRGATDLGEIARKMIDELRAAHPEATVELSTDGDVTGEWDGARLEQVLSNLVSNGIDHGEAGYPVEVSLRGEPAAVGLHVRSRGEMPRAALEHAFEAFHRGPEETGKKASGLGLGLYIAREIVRHHGGEISVQCAEGATVIDAWLPRRPAQESGAAAE